MKQVKLLLPVLLAGALASGTTAKANLLTGSIWENMPSSNADGEGSNPNPYGLATAGDGTVLATLANVGLLQAASVAPNVTFSVNTPLTFNSANAGNGYTIGGFLGTGGATITTGASDAGNTMDNTLFYFTGTVTMMNGETFTVGHDDGLQLQIGGTLVVDAAGPTSFDNTSYTWTGASGNYSFELAYAEVDGPPAVLETDLPLTVPEPTTMIAGAMLLLPFGASTLRMFRKSRNA